ncbi:DUF551 domain-containing protein [Escherichia coli]|uniref:DUF551 domain-containing protein n=1 Tax=Escherichia coli TaxID=562 RepID=UPI0013D473B3|nr:DUF551 domain-containing protein [Escherichia coli]
MSNITKELAKLFRKITNSEIDAEGNAHVVLSPADSLLINNARIALASLEAEPVAWAHRLINKRNGVVHPWVYGSAEACPSEGDIFNIEVMPLYTAPPAPVSVPAAMEMDDDFDSAFEHGKAVGWNAYRAAMLQGAEQQNRQQNIPENIPATQFKPVADLYGLTSPTGSETSFTFDAVEARDFIDGGWSCQEYVELERFQEAMLQNGNSPAQSDCCPEQNYIAPAQDGNSPVIPDGWISCSEQMPSAGEQVLAYRPDAPESNDPLIKMATYVGGSAHGHGFDCYCKPTHWMPLPAAPQQEVTQALAKGMERYGDAMRELAKKEEK